MYILHLHEAIYHKKPIITYEKTWVWPTRTSLVKVGWNIFTGKTEVDIDKKEVLSIKGHHLPVTIWDEISLTLLAHDIICAPLQVVESNITMDQIGPLV